MYETLRTCGHLGPVGPAWLGSSGAGGGESGCELPGPCVAIVVSVISSCGCLSSCCLVSLTSNHHHHRHYCRHRRHRLLTFWLSNMAGCTICHADMIYFRKKHAAANQGLAFICVYSALNLQPFLQILSQNWFKGKKTQNTPQYDGGKNHCFLNIFQVSQ
jgi:hypothetical protein